MGEIQPEAKLLDYSKNAERNVAIASRLCYSDDGAENLMRKMDNKEIKKQTEMILNLGHTSVLEHTYFLFHVVCSRVTSHQLVRQRIGVSYSQRSQRYVKEDDFDYIVPPNIKNNEDMYIKFKERVKQLKEDYIELTENNIPNEDARFILPTIKTNLLVSYNARSLYHFFKLRCCNRSQWEIRMLADSMLNQVKDVTDVLFKDAGPNCVREGCKEGKMSCGNPRTDL